MDTLTPYTLPENAPLWLVEIYRRLAEGDVQMREMSDELKANSAVTGEVKALLDEGKAGLRVLGRIGVVAKWVTTIAAAVSAICGAWWVVRHGPFPSK